MNHSRKFITIAAIVTISLVTFGCNISSPDENEEHEEPRGLILLDSGNEIARQFDGEVTYASGEHIELEEGEKSSLITIRFLNENGVAFTPHDDNFSLSWDIEQENIVEIEQHEEDGSWSFHFVGVGTGEAHIIFLLMHGDEDHAHPDFESLEFQIHVEGSD